MTGLLLAMQHSCCLAIDFISHPNNGHVDCTYYVKGWGGLYQDFLFFSAYQQAALLQLFVT
jgi:hypothetical protein